MDVITTRAGAVYVHVRVQPKASRNAVIFEADGRIKVTLTAPPVEGAANKALVVFIAERLGIPKRQVFLEKGERSREKSLRIEGIDAEAIWQKLKQ